MRTLGIDLATTAGSTGICEINWSNGQSAVEVSRHLTNATIASSICALAADDEPGWTAIDAPFGFPAAFTGSVLDWDTTGTVPQSRDDDIRRRLTDRYVACIQKAMKATPHHWPLSPVSSLITPTAIRCAQILTTARHPLPVDRIGLASRVVEAYPIAALRVWGIASTNYKSNATTCQHVLQALWQLAGLPHPPTLHGQIPAGCYDDAVDAFVCALVARSVALANGTTGPLAAGAAYASQMTAVKQEGWIHLPPLILPTGPPRPPPPSPPVGWTTGQHPQLTPSWRPTPAGA